MKTTLCLFVVAGAAWAMLGCGSREPEYVELPKAEPGAAGGGQPIVSPAEGPSAGGPSAEATPQFGSRG